MQSVNVPSNNPKTFFPKNLNSIDHSDDFGVETVRITVIPIKTTNVIFVGVPNQTTKLLHSRISLGVAFHIENVNVSICFIFLSSN